MARPENEAETPLGERLRNFRRELGDPERDAVAKALNVSKNTLAAYERGQRTPDATVLEMYHKVYGVNLTWLITGVGEMFDTPAANLKHSAKMQSGIVKKLARLVKALHSDAGITLKSEDIAAEATELYNYLCVKVDDLSDMNEVEAAFPLLELRIKKKMAEAIAEPGTGKRKVS